MPTSIDQIIAQQDNFSPKEIELRAREWARTLTIAGKDDGQSESTEYLAPYIKYIQQNMTPSNGRIVLNELSEAVEAQWELAKVIHEASQPERFARYETSLFGDPAVKPSELISDTLSLLHFLKEPYTADTASHFSKEQSDFPSDKVEQFYNSFWYLPFDKRVEFLSDVMGLNGGRNFYAVVRQVINSSLVDQFLPPEHPEYGEAAAYEIGLKLAGALENLSSGRTIVKAIVAAIDAIHHDKLEVALTAQRDPERADPEVRAGYRLGRFLSNHDSGGHKVSQFGHGAPNRNDKWDRGLAGSKSEAGRVSRYEFLQWLNDSVPLEMRRLITRVGAYEGTGSWVATYQIELDREYVRTAPQYGRYRNRHSGKKFVISILKPDAYKKGTEFIDELLELAELVIIQAEGNGDKTTVDSVKTLIKIVEQAKRAVKWETNLHNSEKQEKLAREFYDAVHVIVGGHKYTSYTQDAFDYGQNYRVSLRVAGQHFNQLTTNTTDDPLYVRRTAVAKFTLAVLMALRGKQFNHDIHGDNGGVRKISANETELGEFDNGALDVEAPTIEQKRIFADCLISAAANSQRNGYEFFSSLKHTISETAKNLGPERQKDIEYVDSLMRSVISIGDYMRHMKAGDYRQALLGLVAAGGIDSEILMRSYLRLSANEILRKNTFLSALTKGLSYTAWVSGSAMEAAKREEPVHEARYYPNNPSKRLVQRNERRTGERYPKLEVEVNIAANDDRWTPLTRNLSLGVRGARTMGLL